MLGHSASVHQWAVSVPSHTQRYTALRLLWRGRARPIGPPGATPSTHFATSPSAYFWVG